MNPYRNSIFPIEDSSIAATQGSNKDLLVRGNLRHVGNPGAEEIIYDWLDEAISRGS